jgi:hypothetical protein
MKFSSFLFLSTSSATASAFTSNSANPHYTMALAASKNRRDFFMDAAAVATALTILPQVASAEARPMYLTDPTADFKESEAKSMEFKRQQLLLKKEFNTVLDRLVVEPNDEVALAKDLADLKILVAKTGGMPLGIKKEEMYKIIRTKKARGFWPTPVEYA